jgi:hypothetical protein
MCFVQAPKLRHPSSIMNLSNTGGHGRGGQSGRIVGETWCGLKGGVFWWVGGDIGGGGGAVWWGGGGRLGGGGVGPGGGVT